MLDRINCPDDVKKLTIKELEVLCQDIRTELIDVVKNNGGHLASNLGVVELTVALHYVFSSPKDKIIFDVGHQSYVHKILTDRKDKFSTIRQPNGISGFPKRSESIHDVCDSGHAGSALSTAIGITKANEMENGDRKVISIIGDGALFNGMTFEGLNNIYQINSNSIIILNDNGMSISKTVGGLSRKFSKFRVNVLYTNLKGGAYKVFKFIPFGKKILSGFRKIKNGFAKLFLHRVAMFEEMGLSYVGPIDGHNLKSLIKYLKKCSKLNKPILLHVMTKKGKGDENCENCPDVYHAVYNNTILPENEYSNTLADTLTSMAKKDDRVVAVTAAMEGATGLLKFKQSYPDKVIDVGISEEFAVTFCSGLALAGKKPYLTIYSTFLQRGFDQILTDVALQNLPVTFCIDRAGLATGDGETHQGVFDVSYLSLIPNLTIVAPKDKVEFSMFLDFSLTYDKPLAIRYPRISNKVYETHKEITYASWEYVKNENANTLLIASGESALAFADNIASNFGISVGIINARFIKPMDEQMLDCIKDKNLIVLEENAIKGGLGESIVFYYSQKDISAKVKCFGLKDEFIPHGSRECLLNNYGLNKEEIISYVREIVDEIR